jgi:hypothetical protein
MRVIVRRSAQAVLISSFVLAAVLSSAAHAAAGSSESTRSPSPAVAKLHVAYRQIGWAPVSTDGNYTFVPGPSGIVANGTQGGTVINETTGAKVTVPPPPDCGSWSGPVAGGSSVVYECQQSVGNDVLSVYSLPNGPWGSLPINSTIANICAAQPGPGGCYLNAAGSDWVDWANDCYHCGTSYLFENLATGAMGPTTSSLTADGGTEIVDLSRASLYRAVCRPLAAPTDGQFVFAGSFALDDQSQVYLERCGRNLHELLGAGSQAVAGTTGIAMWSEYVGRQVRLDGIFLPSRQRFSVNAPPRASSVTQIALSATHLYIYGFRTTQSPDGINELWVAPRPRRH